jgi:hypothetical protein
MWRLGLFAVTAALGAAQVVLVGVLAGMEIAHTGGTAAAVPAVTAAAVAKSSAAVSLLFVCASLPLYLGAEVRRPTVTTARSLPFAVGIATACALVGVVALTRFPVSFLGAELPGWLIAVSLGGRTLGQVIVAGTAISIMTLVLLEYVALTRLLNVMLRARPRRAELGVGALFVASAALSLLDPSAAYEKLLTPALVALYLSQVVVFAVYPRFRRRQGNINAADIVVASAASALMLYGLYTVL